MAEPEIPAPPPPPPPPPAPLQPSQQYWCYHCDKRVTVETVNGEQNDVVCSECKFGFVESLPSPPTPPPPPQLEDDDDDDDNTNTLGSQFLQVLRLIAQVSRTDTNDLTANTFTNATSSRPLPPPPLSPPHDDFLRIEIDGWPRGGRASQENETDEDEEDGNRGIEDVDEDERSVEIEGGDNDNDEGEDEDYEEEEDDAEVRRRTRDILHLRLRDFANRVREERGRNNRDRDRDRDRDGRIFDWAEILMGLEDNAIEFRFEMPETMMTDRYVGNPGDYVNAAEYEALLQNLADAEGRRGAPPAAKRAIDGLRVKEVRSEEDGFVCAVCKDAVGVGEVVKEMPCGHGYHGDCIVPWLEARNSCPVCRFELETDDAEYEEERKKRGAAGGGGPSSASASA